MTDSEVLRVFDMVHCARVGDEYAPHKPIVLLLTLEMIAQGHENLFRYQEFDAALQRLLTKYGSPSAAAARNEPFWRLQRDGIFEVSSPFSLLMAPDKSPSPTQLVEFNVSARMPSELFDALRLRNDLAASCASNIAAKFLNARTRRSIFAEAAPNLSRSQTRYWWVSQNRTFREEVLGNFLWSPKKSAGGRVNPNYDFMRDLIPGDVVFNFYESAIKAISVVRQEAVSCPKPTTFGARGNQWDDDGWLVEVVCYQLHDFAIRPSEHMRLIGPTLPDRHSPIRLSGVGNQVYLTPVPASMADVLLALIGPTVEPIITEAIPIALRDQLAEAEESFAIDDLKKRNDIGQTEKDQLIRARRGQGLFRAGVSLVEQRCRVTQISDKIHLIASHIKPWAQSTDEERLSRFNGLLLSPHADHLFDKGFISFHDAGSIIVSKRLDAAVLQDWHIDSDLNVGIFRSEQRPFLEYHRDAILRR